MDRSGAGGRGGGQLRRRRRPGSKPQRPAPVAAPPPRLFTEHHRSAGGLVVDGLRILLISTQNGRRWQLPKGHVEAGETAEEAAVREVREETGVTGRIVAPLPEVEYWYVERGPRRIHKRVEYFLLEYVSGTNADFDPQEVSGAEWFSWDTGLGKLSFENERRVVEQARNLRNGETAGAPGDHSEIRSASKEAPS
jgi:8-oxo-dGTP pyrophosphatase MutT (NUDIX family)